jgi:hypothetical protein
MIDGTGSEAATGGVHVPQDIEDHGLLVAMAK